jgi:hypothetical protein
MVADTLGFYLPFLVIRGYFVHVFREELGALGNTVAMAVMLYVMVGVTGAVMQFATCHHFFRDPQRAASMQLLCRYVALHSYPKTHAATHSSCGIRVGYQWKQQAHLCPLTALKLAI